MSARKQDLDEENGGASMFTHAPYVVSYVTVIAGLGAIGLFLFSTFAFDTKKSTGTISFIGSKEHPFSEFSASEQAQLFSEYQKAFGKTVGSQFVLSIVTLLNIVCISC
jgi:hypothetical protein